MKKLNKKGLHAKENQILLTPKIIIYILKISYKNIIIKNNSSLKEIINLNYQE